MRKFTARFINERIIQMTVSEIIALAKIVAYEKTEKDQDMESLPHSWKMELISAFMHIDTFLSNKDTRIFFTTYVDPIRERVGGMDFSGTPNVFIQDLIFQSARAGWLGALLRGIFIADILPVVTDSDNRELRVAKEHAIEIIAKSYLHVAGLELISE